MGEIKIVGSGKTLGYPYPVCKKVCSSILVLQIRRGKTDNLGIIFHITPLKLML